MLRKVSLGLSLFALAAVPALGHHGWGYYNTSDPALFSGTISEVDWSNPHPIVTITIDEGTPMPNASTWAVPEQLMALGFEDLLSSAQPIAAGTWALDLAPINRLERRGLPRQPQVGDRLEGMAFVSCDGAGVMRPNLIVLDGASVPQQSVELPAGCSGEPRG